LLAKASRQAGEMLARLGVKLFRLAVDSHCNGNPAELDHSPVGWFRPTGP
jgi:hypothetical protein